MHQKRRVPYRVIQSWDEGPGFKTDAEEAEFWAGHALGTDLLDGLRPIADDVLPSARPRTTPLAVRFDQDVIRRLRASAEKKHKGYQTLLKEFVIERLYEEEKREGLVG